MTTNEPTSTLTYPVTITTDSSVPTSTEHRLSKHFWKKPKDAKADYKTPVARCVSIPKVTLACEPSILSALFQSAFEKMQDAVIKEEIEKNLAAGRTTELFISELLLTPTAIATYASELSTGGHLSSDKISAWFATDCEQALINEIIAKRYKDGSQPSEEDLKKIAATVEGTKVTMMRLSGTKSTFAEQTAKQLQWAAKLAEESVTRTQLLTKLSAILQPKKAIEENLGLPMDEE
jgi:hypothetical protein